MNILIADDHDIFRQSLALLLESRSAHRIIGHVASFTELLQVAKSSSPDCILLDYHMPGGEPLRSAQELRTLCPGVKIIMLTGAQSGALLKQLVQPMFDGVLHKREDANILLEGIEQVAQGHVFISPEARTMIEDAQVDLTSREMQILTQFMQGLSPTSVAQALCISVRTVEKHKENLMKKLNVSNTVQMIEMGHRLTLDQ